MNKKSRLNPNRESRATLELLQNKGVLRRQKVGIRHIVRTDGSIERVGYDINMPEDHGLPNFHPGACRLYRTVVRYDGARAELTATLGWRGWEGHVMDVGTHFPRNQLATDLFNPGQDPASTRVVFGDAILINDNRMHWALSSSWKTRTVQDVEYLDGMLKSPRTFQKDEQRATIFFHEEPQQADLVTIKLSFC